MTDFRATKNRSQGRSGWCAIFQHPLRQRDGKPLRVRRGLGTRDDEEADRRIEQLNRLLSDRAYWSPTARARAERELDIEVVRAFYDGLTETEHVDGWETRDEVIELPDKTSGYTRVLIFGPTGSGKTTFLRQLIGSDPARDRFPSTATAKTTTAAIEVVMDVGDGLYRAVVSFSALESVRAYIEECTVAAVSSAADGGHDEQVMEALMEDREQRFRLAYVVGSWSPPSSDIIDEDDVWGSWDDGDALGGGSEAPNSCPTVARDEHEADAQRLQSYLDRIRQVSQRVRASVEDEIGFSPEDASGGDREAFLELLEERGYEDEEVQLLVDDILDDVSARFGALRAGTIEKGRDDWPTRWQFESSDRSAFLREVNRFTSNYAPSFGKLLTPLVAGIRVAGPFRPKWLPTDQKARLVLMDGEGLGHTTATSASLPTTVTKAYGRADLILLVDSAKQPMLAAPVAALRDVTSNGYDGRLAILFTHFDLMAHDNVVDKKAARAHVIRSIDNAVAGLEQPLGSTTARALRRNIRERIFFAAGINKPFEKLPAWQKLNTSQMARFLALCQDIITPPAGTHVTPIYDSANLVLCVTRATAQFQQSWQSRLGIARRDERKEHWTRVRALARRLGLWGQNQYSTLRPVADLGRELTEAVTDFIANPRAWEPHLAKDEDKDRSAERVRREMSSRVHDVVETRLRIDHTVDWREAFRYSGVGSGNRRSVRIWTIYQEVAPVPTEVPNRESSKLLDLIRRIFLEAVAAAGGRVVDATGQISETTLPNTADEDKTALAARRLERFV